MWYTTKKWTLCLGSIGCVTEDAPPTSLVTPNCDIIELFVDAPSQAVALTIAPFSNNFDIAFITSSTSTRAGAAPFVPNQANGCIQPFGLPQGHVIPRRNLQFPSKQEFECQNLILWYTSFRPAWEWPIFQILRNLSVSHKLHLVLVDWTQLGSVACF